jgi:hypothetical protein
MSAIECGRKVLRGIRRNDMYILTHPEFRPGLKDRFDAILASFPTDPDPVPDNRMRAESTVLRNEAYGAELNRLSQRRGLYRTRRERT